MRVVEDLSLRLYKLDSSQLSFSANLDQEYALGFYVTKSDRFDLLSVCNSDSFTIWQQGQMIQDLSLCFEVFSNEISESSDSDTVYFALLSSGYFRGLEVSLLADRIDEMQLQNVASLKETPIYNEWSMFMLFVLGFFAVAIRQQNPGLFAYLFGVSIGRSRETEIVVELNSDLILSLLFVSLISIYNIQLLRLVTSESTAISTFELILDTLRLSLIVAIVLLFKYFFISFLAGINTLTTIKGIQFVDFIKFFSLGGVVFLILLQIGYWQGYGFAFQSFWMFENFYLIIYSAFILYFYLKLVQGTSFKKLHIITYLCTTEFIGVFLLALIIYK